VHKENLILIGGKKFVTKSVVDLVLVCSRDGLLILFRKFICFKENSLAHIFFSFGGMC
jgi:hypothetical protein